MRRSTGVPPAPPEGQRPHRRPLLEDKAAYVGIDAGSTTVKAVAVNPGRRSSLPLPAQLLATRCPWCGPSSRSSTKVPGYPGPSSASTGYGEEIIQNAFGLDMGVVETIAHFTAAKKFDPQVDFIIDIGGQDIKCFKIKNGTIDNIF